jgi:hypothetical protein
MITQPWECAALFNAVLMFAVGGSIAVALTLDLMLLCAVASRVWTAMLMERS